MRISSKSVLGLLGVLAVLMLLGIGAVADGGSFPFVLQDLPGIEASPKMVKCYDSRSLAWAECLSLRDVIYGTRYTVFFIDGMPSRVVMIPLIGEAREIWYYPGNCEEDECELA